MSRTTASYDQPKKYSEEETVLRRALAIREKALAADHPDLLTTLGTYARLLRRLQRPDEVAALENRLQALQVHRN
jgi:hypothetical protein